MQALMAIIIIPLILLNFAGGIVGGVWLAIRGEWSVIGLGILYMIATPLALGLAILPGLIFAAPAAALMERRHIFLGGLVALPALAWTYAVLGGSCLLVVAYTSAAWDGEAMLAYLLWAYAVAMAPWAYLAQKDEQAGQRGSGATLFFAQVSIVSMGIGTLLNGAPLYWTELILWCGPPIALGLLLDWVLALGSAYEESRMTAFDRLHRRLYD